MDNKPRDYSIDILRCIAAILITNSHLGCLYPESLRVMATGGAIGDALFFFCSGYTLFLGKQRSFMNFYKRRVNRIYPSIFAMAIIACAFFKSKSTIIEIFLQGGGWFVACIMVYYVFMWLIREFLMNKLMLFCKLFFLFVVGCFWIIPRQQGTIIYGTNDYRLLFFFMYMLFGALLGKMRGVYVDKGGMFHNLVLFFVSLLLFYGILYVYGRYGFEDYVQLLSFVPLFGVLYSLYRLCNNKRMVDLYKSKVIGFCMTMISGLCLEIYISQDYIKMPFAELNIVYPVNIIMFFVLVTGLAYVVRTFARFLSQTFSKADYEWKEILKV